MRKHIVEACLICLLVLSSGCIGGRAEKTYKDEAYLEWAEQTADLLLKDCNRIEELEEDDIDVYIEAFKKLYADASKALDEEKEFPISFISPKLRGIWDNLHFALTTAQTCANYGEKYLTDPSEWHLENYAKYKTRLDERLDLLRKDLEEL